MRFPATTIDLSTLPRPQIINTIAFDTIVEEMKADARVRAAAAGLNLDTLDLESETSTVVFQSCAYRELMKRQEVNDDALALLLAFATGPDLEHIGARYGVTRMPAAGIASPRLPVADFPADWEDDSRFRRRIQLAPNAYSNAGTLRAYEYHALSAGTSAEIADVNVFSPAPGRIDAVLLGVTGSPSDTAVKAVYNRLMQRDVKPLTDDVRVTKALVLDYTVSAILRVPRGPTPSIIKSQAETAVRAYAKSTFKVGRKVYRTGLYGALQVPNVFEVLMDTPTDNLDPGNYGAARGNFAITTEVVSE